MFSLLGDHAPTIRMGEISKRIPGSDGSYALKHMCCTIRNGEFVAAIGPSGSGKTTFLSICGLLDSPSSGLYEINGTDTSLLSEPDRNSLRGMMFGFVFQNSYLIQGDSVGSSVALGLRVRGLNRSARNLAVRESLAAVGMEWAIEKRAEDLSGGEKQRVAVARALATSPPILLADEPTGALDSASTENLISILREVNSSGTTIIVVTHDPMVANAADRRLTIMEGEHCDDNKAP